MADDLKELQTILRKRLPDIKRWRKVSVFGYGDDLPSEITDTNTPKEDKFYIYWNGNKGKNIHRFEVKEAELSAIKDIIRRNTERLENNRKVYK